MVRYLLLALFLVLAVPTLSGQSADVVVVCSPAIAGSTAQVIIYTAADEEPAVLVEVTHLSIPPGDVKILRGCDPGTFIVYVPLPPSSQGGTLTVTATSGGGSGTGSVTIF
jgi:hypothetical protein